MKKNKIEIGPKSKTCCFIFSVLNYKLYCIKWGLVVDNMSWIHSSGVSGVVILIFKEDERRASFPTSLRSIVLQHPRQSLSSVY